MDEFLKFVHYSNTFSYMILSTTLRTGDPSTVIQSFGETDITVHCCRYWWLKRWRPQRISFPYWRLYWNRTPGAYVFFKERININPNQIILIPPNTDFGTCIIADDLTGDEDYGTEGGWIQSYNMEATSIENGFIPHFYIHFNLGYQYDNIKPGIYTMNKSEKQERLISILLENLLTGGKSFTLHHTLAIHSLILSAVTEIPEDAWEKSTVGSKIQESLNYINKNFKNSISNNELAHRVFMASNSFARLFKEQTKQTIQAYIRKKRIEHACKVLSHTNKSIKEIAVECGFIDRYHFTRVFVQVMDIPPAKYRKQLIYSTV